MGRLLHSSTRFYAESSYWIWVACLIIVYMEPVVTQVFWGLVCAVYILETILLGTLYLKLLRFIN